MTRASPSIFATQAVAAYEALRTAVLSGRSTGQRGLAILIHRGLTAWIVELKPEEAPATPSAPMLHPSLHSTNSTSTPSELTCVLAGIIVALTTGDAHAHS